MIPKFVNLKWDSEFFQFKVCRFTQLLENIEQLRSVELVMKKGDYKLAYYSSSVELKTTDIGSLEIKLVDEKTTYTKRTNGHLHYHQAISTYPSITPTDKLFELAIQSGVYSRFNVDENISRQKFEELYRIWITRSVKRENASEVFVYNYNNDIAGYLTVGQKNSRADLGMGAVDLSYRGAGIGRAIFQHAEKWSYDNGFSEIQVVTQGNNLSACRLYESLGYKIEKSEYFYHIWRA
jgi:dTDP-4-amino-4,6-dideoxy-D-galactose acyltransferase